MLHFSNLLCIVASYSWHSCLDFASLWVAPPSIAYTKFLLTLTLHIGFTLAFTLTLTKSPLCHSQVRFILPRKSYRTGSLGLLSFRLSHKENWSASLCHHYKALLQRTQLSSLVQECGKLVTCIFCCSVLYFLFVTHGIRTLKKVFYIQ